MITPPVHRFEVSPKPDQADPIGAAVMRDAGAIGIAPTSVRATHVYLIQANLTAPQLRAVGEQLLADPVTETARVGASPAVGSDRIIEVHPLPGVMDPVAQSVQEGVRELVAGVGDSTRVSTGWRYDVGGVSAEQAGDLARRLLANPVIHRVVDRPLHPASFPVPAAHEQQVRSIALRGLSDEQLVKLSREAHLFLSLDEMKAIQAEYTRLGREPRDIELETLAQTWSEHCVHKTLKATVRYRGEAERRGGEEASREGAESHSDPINWHGRPGHEVMPDGSVVIHNLLKSTIAAATHELIAEGVDWTLSVFKDNSGVIAFDEQWGVCIKVETHNHPSAIEPYGGAATGIGGCIRDVIGTGLGALPIAATDVFCVAGPKSFTTESTESTESGTRPSGVSQSAEDSVSAHSSVIPVASVVSPSPRPLPPGTLHPRRVLSQIVAGVRDYGNRMGIPTVNGGVFFDDRYVGNPLVYCGCIGLIPRDLVHGTVHVGDRIIALGGRTGRDGIHGATFSSAELEHTAADEFAHAVQIGNAIEEKRVLDAIMRARDADGGPLYTAMTDCGAGGFSSAVGEMGKDLGAQVHLERAPLKYPGLSYTEIWISEAQERMVLAVPPQNLAALRAICEQESVEMADLGQFGTPGGELVLTFHGQEVGRMSTHFLHEGIPTPVREASWSGVPKTPATPVRDVASPRQLKDVLWQMLSHPTIASKHWIIRQYDHEVRGNTVVKPLVGRGGRGPGDAAVIEPIAGTGRGIAIGCGLQTPIGDPALGGDAYLMALAAIDECVRNLVCVGADPDRIAILDNFCWPSCGKPENMGTLVRACEGCYDGAKAYRTPFVSGKDSLNNQLKYVDPATGKEHVIEIPPTLLITGLGIVSSVRRSCTSDAKRAGNMLVLVGATTRAMGGSMLQTLGYPVLDASMPRVDLRVGPAVAKLASAIIRRGTAVSAHDCSEGGALVAVAEMLIGSASGAGGSLGARLMLGTVGSEGGVDVVTLAFAESPSRYVLEVAPADVSGVLNEAHKAGVAAAVIGELDNSGLLTDPDQRLSAIVGDLAWQWMSPLDW